MTKLPWWSAALLVQPQRISERLDGLAKSARYARVPNAFQLSLGILRMWDRLLWRSQTVGTSDAPVRQGLRAKLLALRPLRFPFLVWERAIAPLDGSGLRSDRERMLRHLLGAHHDRKQFAYDLEILWSDPEALLELERRALRVVRGEDNRAEYLRDLVVFEGYHEALLEATRRAQQGELDLSCEEARDPDVSFSAYLGWCAEQPETPAQLWAAFARGEYSLEHGLVNARSAEVGG